MTTTTATTTTLVQCTPPKWTTQDSRRLSQVIVAEAGEKGNEGGGWALRVSSLSDKSICLPIDFDLQVSVTDFRLDYRHQQQHNQRCCCCCCCCFCCWCCHLCHVQSSLVVVVAAVLVRDTCEHTHTFDCISLQLRFVRHFLNTNTLTLTHTHPYVERLTRTCVCVIHFISLFEFFVSFFPFFCFFSSLSFGSCFCCFCFAFVFTFPLLILIIQLLRSSKVAR